MLVRQLPAESATNRSLNEGQTPWSNTDHRIADIWKLWAGKEHPVRAEIEAKARTAAKHVRVIQLRATFERRKRTYGLG